MEKICPDVIGRDGERKRKRKKEKRIHGGLNSMCGRRTGYVRASSYCPYMVEYEECRTDWTFRRL